ncbi:hypothetical protein [Limnohabitans sp.]
MTEKELDDYIYNLKTTFRGDLTDLAAALGALDLGRTYGWKVLRIIYSPIAYRKYQKILNLEFKEVLSDETDFSMRSAGYKLVDSVSNYWDIVSRKFSLDSKIRTSTVS